MATWQPKLFSSDSSWQHCSRGYFHPIHRGHIAAEAIFADSLRLHCSRGYFRSIHRGYIAAEAIFVRFIAATLQPRLFSLDSLRLHCSRGYFRSIHRGYIAANLNK
jgi:hypothetical protein